MRIDRNTGLVLEGGGMRGVFTSGVLDGFMKHDLYFRYVVAVSAGACNGMSYMTTNCQTGQAMYLSEKHDRQRALDIVRASSSLPYVSKIVEVDGIPMLDGGIVDSIPVQRAIDMGHPFNVVVCTRNKGYRETGRDDKIPRFIYRNYPRLRVALSRRKAAYNKQ